MKPLSADHLDHVMTWINDPDIVKNFQHFDKQFTREDELGFIKKLIASDSNRVFSVFDEENNYVGQVGLNQISWENKLGRLAVFVKKEHRGKGYAQEMIRLILDKAFKELGLHKVWLVVYADNAKAIHIYEKLGFQKEGVLKDEYYWQGRYHDMMRMAIVN